MVLADHVADGTGRLFDLCAGHVSQIAARVGDHEQVVIAYGQFAGNIRRSRRIDMFVFAGRIFTIQVQVQVFHRFLLRVGQGFRGLVHLRALYLETYGNFGSRRRVFRTGQLRTAAEDCGP